MDLFLSIMVTLWKKKLYEYFNIQRNYKKFYWYEEKIIIKEICKISHRNFIIIKQYVNKYLLNNLWKNIEIMLILEKF